MDRWRLPREHMTLTITRKVIQGTQQSEGVLVYRGEGWQVPEAATPIPAASARAEEPRPVLIRPGERNTPAAQADVTVPAGKHIALALRNAVDTKHSKERHRIYLETTYPLPTGRRVV